MTYFDALTEAMTNLASDERVVFIGQGIQYGGTFQSNTFSGVPKDKLIEFPVAEEMQAGVAIGMSLDGLIPVCVYPRYNFMVCAANQLVNHLDKMQPHVIVRVGVGSTTPLYPGEQHVGDFSEAFRLMMPNTPIIQLHTPEDIINEYRAALDRTGPTILVEIADLY